MGSEMCIRDRGLRASEHYQKIIKIFQRPLKGQIQMVLELCCNFVTKNSATLNNVVKANNMNGMDKYDAEVVHCETSLKSQIWATPALHLSHERYIGQV